jgi:hypothetical protein
MYFQAKMLTLIGGSDVKQLIRRIKKKNISDELAIEYNYTGHKNTKKAFNKTILSTLLTSKYFLHYGILCRINTFYIHFKDLLIILTFLENI